MNTKITIRNMFPGIPHSTILLPYILTWRFLQPARRFVGSYLLYTGHCLLLYMIYHH